MTPDEIKSLELLLHILTHIMWIVPYIAVQVRTVGFLQYILSEEFFYLAVSMSHYNRKKLTADD